MTPLPSMPNNDFLGAVNSKDELPAPIKGLFAFDATRSVDGRSFMWMVVDNEWVSKEFVSHYACPYCGR